MLDIDAGKGTAEPGLNSDPELSSESSSEFLKRQPAKKRGGTAKEPLRADNLDDDYDPNLAKVDKDTEQRTSSG